MIITLKIVKSMNNDILENDKRSFQQKVAIGDKDGVLQVFSSKRGEIHHSFNYTRSESLRG